MIAGDCALPYHGGVLLGATHDHVGAGENPDTHATDTVEITEKYAALFDEVLPKDNWETRAAVRVTTRNTLPIACPIKSQAAGLYVLSGLGARGLMMAPLLAEYLISHALDEPSPLDQKTAARFGLPKGANNT